MPDDNRPDTRTPVITGQGQPVTYSGRVAFVRLNPLTPGRARRRTSAVLVVLGAALVLAAVLSESPVPRWSADRPPVGVEPIMPTGFATGTGLPAPTAEPTLPAVPPPANLPVVDYGPAPRGFPRDPAPMSTVRLGEGLRPISRIAAYDAPVVGPGPSSPPRSAESS